MNSIINAPAPTLDELLAVAHQARATLNALQRQRAELDDGMPVNPVERALWYESKAELPALDAACFRARAASEKADADVQAARERHARQVREELAPERRALLLKLKQALDLAARISADGQAIDDYSNIETDGHGYAPGAWWAAQFTVDSCELEWWTRTLRKEGWLP